MIPERFHTDRARARTTAAPGGSMFVSGEANRVEGQAIRVHSASDAGPGDPIIRMSASWLASGEPMIGGGAPLIGAGVALICCRSTADRCERVVDRSGRSVDRFGSGADRRGTAKDRTRSRENRIRAAV